MSNYIIVFDVGGVFIRSAVLNEDGVVVPNSFAVFPAHSDQSKEKIIHHLFSLMQHQSNSILDREINILGVGFAFPGPFDYEAGISYIKGVGKFDSLYGVDLRKRLFEKIQQTRSFATKLADSFEILFENNANLFALGEQYNGKGKDFERTIYLTIGAGTGSAFMIGDQLVKTGYGIPENGWIYKQPFKDSIVDDYISQKGILKIAETHGMNIEDPQVKAFAEMAEENDGDAIKVFHEFGRTLGEVLKPYIESFNPEAIILGGQIAKSKHLFIDGLDEAIDTEKLVIETTTHTSFSTFAGVAKLLDQRMVEQYLNST